MSLCLLPAPCFVFPALFLSSFPSSLSGQARPLFVPATDVPDAARAWDAEERARMPSLVQSSFVHFDAAALRAGRPLRLVLFGTSAVFEIDEVRRSLRHEIFVGRVPGSKTEILFAVDAAGVGAGHLQIAERTYELGYTGHRDIHVLRRVDWTKADRPEDRCAVDHRHFVAAGPGDPVEPGQDGRVFVDVAVFYTPRARSTGGGKAAIEAEIALRIATATLGNKNSKVGWEFRLVYVGETNYTEDGSSRDLSRFRSTSDGNMDEVHAIRSNYGADLMALITQPSQPQYCGVAYLMTSLSTGFRTAAFGVTLRQCLRGHTLSHEMGHNCASHHDRANAGSALYPYSYGWRTPDNRYRTIMSYAPGSRVNYWSNPNVKYLNYPMGTANADNTRSLNNVRNTLAAFYPTKMLEWCELGGGVRGALGLPTLTGSGTINNLVPIRVTTGRVASGAPGVLVISGREWNLNVLGGTLVPHLDVVLVVPANATVAASFLRLLPSRTSVWFQAWYFDRAAVQDFSATNAIKTRTP